MTDVTPTTMSTTGLDYQQRSHVAAVDATYDLSARRTIGGKLAWRVGELTVLYGVFDFLRYSETAWDAHAQLGWRVS